MGSKDARFGYIELGDKLAGHLTNPKIALIIQPTTLPTFQMRSELAAVLLPTRLAGIPELERSKRQSEVGNLRSRGWHRLPNAWRVYNRQIPLRCTPAQVRHRGGLAQHHAGLRGGPPLRPGVPQEEHHHRRPAGPG